MQVNIAPELACFTFVLTISPILYPRSSLIIRLKNSLISVLGKNEAAPLILSKTIRLTNTRVALVHSHQDAPLLSFTLKIRHSYTLLLLLAEPAATLMGASTAFLVYWRQ